MSISIRHYLDKLHPSARHFFSKLTGESGVRLFSFIFISVLARRIPVAQFGVYSTVVAYTTLFLVIVECANNAIITREVARHVKDRARIIGSAHLSKIILASVALLCIHVFSRSLIRSGISHLLIDSLGVVAISYSLIDYTGVLLAGKEEMGQEAKLRVTCRTLMALTGIGCIFYTRSLTVASAAMAGVGVLSLLYGQKVILRRFRLDEWSVDQATIFRIMSASVPLLATYAFSLVYDNQDILLLKHFLVSNQKIGLYWSANKVLDVLKVVPMMLAGAFFPALSKSAHSPHEFRRQMKILLRWSLMFVPMIFLATYLCAPLIQRLLFGAPFVVAAPLLRLLLFAYVSTFFNYIGTYLLIAGNQERWLLPGAVVVCGLNFGLCWWWIPLLGSAGVCYSLIASELVYLLYQYTVIALVYQPAQ